MKQIIKSFIRTFGIDVHKYSGLSPVAEQANKLFPDKPLIGVEIGIHLGLNAEQMLKKMNLKTLYLIDPYEECGGYKEGSTMKNAYGGMQKVEKLMKKRLKRFENYVHIRKTSFNAWEDIPNEVDFVYIDGNHSYDFVLNDMQNYYSKVKEGGILGGHDFNSPDVSEVTNAVIGFVKKYNLQLFSHRQDWWIIKGRGRIKNNYGGESGDVKW